VLWPEATNQTGPANNNDSLVLRLEHGAVSLLLPGDIERQVESALATSGESLRAEFLKVPHHGSKTSTTEELLGTTRPRVAVISVGETNPFGHPHPDVIGRLRGAGVEVLRTDRNGAVTALSDGHRLEVRSFVTNPPADAADSAASSGPEAATDVDEARVGAKSPAEMEANRSSGSRAKAGGKDKKKRAKRDSRKKKEQRVR
jgi:hypothetical protein